MTSTRSASLLAILALVAAAVLGGAATYAWMSWNARSRPKMSEMTMIGVSRTAILDSLGLTPGQRTRVESLLEQTADRADSSVQRMMREVRAAIQEGRRDVRSVLDPAQQVRFDSLLTRAQEIRPRSPIPPRDSAPRDSAPRRQPD